MVFQTGRNGNLKNSYFKYYNADFDHKGEGSEESYRHEFFKECISRIERLEIRWKGEALTIYPDEILQEETVIMDDGSERIVDLLVRFKSAEPSIYVEKWEGQLAIEIKDTHPVDDRKIHQMKQKGLACFEFSVGKWYIKEDFENAEDEEKQFKEKLEKLEGKKGGYIRGELLVDPISKKYFCTRLYESEREEKEKALDELVELKNIYKETIASNKQLKQEVERLNNIIKQSRKTNDRLMATLKMTKRENEKIKSSFWYKIFNKIEK